MTFEQIILKMAAERVDARDCLKTFTSGYLLSYFADRNVRLGVCELQELLSQLVRAGYLDELLGGGSPTRYLITERGKARVDNWAEPAEQPIAFTVRVSEAALDGWWDSCSEEIKAELFNYFFEEMGGVTSAESQQ